MKFWRIIDCPTPSPRRRYVGRLRNSLFFIIIFLETKFKYAREILSNIRLLFMLFNDDLLRIRKGVFIALFLLYKCCELKV
jgi:hypothetical protein